MRHRHPQQNDIPSTRPDSASPGQLMMSAAPNRLGLWHCSPGRAHSTCACLPPGIGVPPIAPPISSSPALFLPLFTQFYLPSHPPTAPATRRSDSLNPNPPPSRAEQNPFKADPAVEV